MRLFEMHIKEKLINNWIILYDREVCDICDQEKMSGKILFDSFICSNCVERLGAVE
jgi:hypothetical protein